MHLHPVRHHVDRGLSRAAVRDVHEVDGCRRLERLHRDVRRAAVARGGVVDLPGPALRERDELGDRLRRQLVADHHHPGDRRHHAHWHEVLQGIVGHLADVRDHGEDAVVQNASILTMIPNIRQVAYDPLKDFVPVGVVAAITWVMVVSNELPAKTVAEFVALAKSRPGKIDYSSGGNGSPQHVAMEAFKAATAIDLVHIPYRGATQAAVDVMSNRVQVHLGAVSIMLPYIKAGRMRALAVPSAARSPLLPQVPTVAEAGVPGFEWRTWASFVVPLATPNTIVERLNAEMVKAVNSPDVREKLIAQGLEPIGSKPEMVTQWTQDGLKRMRDIVQRAKIQAE